MPIKSWKILSEKQLNNYKIFETRVDRVRSPKTGEEHDVYVVTGASWVNVLAFTPEGKVILVQQYRHGTREVMWEIPGGVIEPDETPAHAGARELIEETGYAGTPARLLGKIHPNPAFQTNLCYTVLILDAKRIREPAMDGTEDIAVRLVEEDEFARMIADGRITHSLVAVADLWRRLWRAGVIHPSVV